MDPSVEVSILFVDCDEGPELLAQICMDGQPAHSCDGPTKVCGIELKNSSWDSVIGFRWIGHKGLHFQAALSLQCIQEPLAHTNIWEGVLGLYGPDVNLDNYSRTEVFDHSVNMGNLYGHSTKVPVAKIRLRFKPPNDGSASNIDSCNVNDMDDSHAGSRTQSARALSEGSGLGGHSTASYATAWKEQLRVKVRQLQEKDRVCEQLRNENIDLQLTVEQQKNEIDRLEGELRLARDEVKLLRNRR
eukprot:GEMP01067739.1.p1 GENE.GEMP01067739.1~~GEMP01067739.1.p1  ORF type:complete len:245 (+),score=35.38 GEMP01067739.1:87-821(+)